VGEVTREEAIEILRDSNRDEMEASIVIYADAYIEYQEASENIREYGSLVSHPRTGSPIDNPFLKVRDRASATLRKIKLDDTGLWL
jgi:phage terminase small subunit